MPAETEPKPTVNADASFDTGDIADVLGMIGRECEKCGELYEHRAWLTRGSRGKRLSVAVVGDCTACDHEHKTITGVEIAIDFDVGVKA